MKHHDKECNRCGSTRGLIEIVHIQEPPEFYCKTCYPAWRRNQADSFSPFREDRFYDWREMYIQDMGDK